VLLVCLVLTSGCAGDPQRAPEDPQQTLDPVSYETRVVERTNRVRASLGRAELTRSPCLEDEARERATDLLGHDGLEHAPLAGVVARCAPGARAAENLVDSAAAPRAVVDAWMGSPGHRNNIVDPALREIGIGCVESDKGMLCSQLFLGDG